MLCRLLLAMAQADSMTDMLELRFSIRRIEQRLGINPATKSEIAEWAAQQENQSGIM